MSGPKATSQTIDWRGRLGLARSVVIYRLIPGRSRRLARFYGPLVQPGDLCFDIGAHVGNRSLALARLGARVVAFEPQPAFASYLRRALRRHDHITLIEAAVGATVGDIVLHVSRRTPTVTTTDQTWIDTVENSNGFAKVSWDAQVTVAQTTLDAMIDRYGVPRLCKIDVEGGEATVLAGLSRPIPLVSFEYMPASRLVAAACIDRLEALGRYTYRATVGESIQVVDDKTWTPDEARDWIFRLPDGARSGDLHARLVADDD